MGGREGARSGGDRCGGPEPWPSKGARTYQRKTEEPTSDPTPHDADPGGGTGATKLGRKEYERELALLQAELVRVQE